MTILPDYFKLKYILIILLFSLPSVFSFAQQKAANINYEKGNGYFASKEYEKAIEYYTFSIEQFPAADAYFNRALSFYELNDSCNYCDDIRMAAIFGDAEAGKLYKKRCVINDIVLNATDSIRQEYPGYSYTLISLRKCSNENEIGYCNNKHEYIESIYVKMPEYPGGDEARVRFLRDNVIYPPIAKENNMQGTVYISFIVEKNGALSNIKILKGLGGGLNKEALRVIKLMPRWKPATRNGVPIKIKFNMPLRWTLN